MAETAMQHEAYAFAAREYGQLHSAGYGGPELETLLTNLVSKHLASTYPNAASADRQSAVRYGVNLALSVLDTSGQPSGIVASAVSTATHVVQAVEEGAGEATAAAIGAGAEAVHAAGDAVSAILAAVELPAAKLPVRAPVDSIGAFGSLTHALGSLLPTALAGATRTRTAMRRIGV